jgi:hypothetical protein
MHSTALDSQGSKVGRLVPAPVEEDVQRCRSGNSGSGENERRRGEQRRRGWAPGSRNPYSPHARLYGICRRGVLLTTVKARGITRKEPITLEVKDIDFQINSMQLEP